MKIGYARTGALEDTGFEDQVSALKAAGCEKILKEACSSVEPRPKLDAALDSLHKGDMLIVTALDRLARTVAHLGQVLERIESVGASLHIVMLELDVRTALAIAEFDDAMRKERHREGVARAKAEGHRWKRTATGTA